MKVSIIGNVAAVVSTLKFADVKKACAKGPVVLRDDKGEAIFGMSVETNKGRFTPAGQHTPAGVVFGYGNKEGLACLNIGPEACGLNDNGSLTPEVVADKFGAQLTALQGYEDQLATATKEAIKAREALLATIETA